MSRPQYPRAPTRARSPSRLRPRGDPTCAPGRRYRLARLQVSLVSGSKPCAVHPEIPTRDDPAFPRASRIEPAQPASDPAATCADKAGVRKLLSLRQVPEALEYGPAAQAVAVLQETRWIGIGTLEVCTEDFGCMQRTSRRARHVENIDDGAVRVGHIDRHLSAPDTPRAEQCLHGHAPDGEVCTLNRLSARRDLLTGDDVDDTEDLVGQSPVLCGAPSSVPASGVTEVDVGDHRAILHTGVSHVKEDYGGQGERELVGVAPQAGGRG